MVRRLCRRSGRGAMGEGGPGRRVLTHLTLSWRNIGGTASAVKSPAKVRPKSHPNTPPPCCARSPSPSLRDGEDCALILPVSEAHGEVAARRADGGAPGAQRACARSPLRWKKCVIDRPSQRASARTESGAGITLGRFDACRKAVYALCTSAWRGGGRQFGHRNSAKEVGRTSPPQHVMLNSFVQARLRLQHPSCRLARTERVEKWTLEAKLCKAHTSSG